MQTFTEPITCPNQPIDARFRVFMSPLDTATTLLLVSDRAYWVYVGRVAQACTPKYVQCHVSTAGNGAQTAELGLFYTVGPPNKSAVSIIKIEATGTIENVTTGSGGTYVRNSTAFSTRVAFGTHLWAGMRTALVTTQPTMVALRLDGGYGHVQTTSTAGALTGAGPWTGAIPVATLLGLGPDLRVELD